MGDYSTTFCWPHCTQWVLQGLPKGHPEAVLKLQHTSRYHFHFVADFRQENQKLKELVTGGATAAGSAAAPSDAEAAEAKEEPVKEESAAVRPKMEATTPQKVVKTKLHGRL